VYILRSALFILLLLASSGLNAQNPELKVTPPRINIDSLKSRNSAPKDTIPPLPADSLRKDSVAVKGDLETTVKYFARDSIVLSVDGKHAYLYGKSKIDYGDIHLSAERIEIDYERNLLIADPVVDSTGKMIGKPIFEEGTEKYETTHIKYNFKTKKAYILGVVTEESEGFMHGEEVKKDQEDNLYIKNARYTTCDLAHPHYYIQARKIVVIPSEKVIAGPFNLNINDVPTPLGFPFGMFPIPEQRSSGIIFPSYGEEVRRGFYMSNGGYYLGISDYINLAVTGDVYSTGSYGIHAASVYKKRYHYGGNVRFDFTSTKTGDEKSKTVAKDFRINWSHTPQNYGTGRFSINVDAATNSFNQNNKLEIENNIRTTLSSSISYSKTFTGTPFSMGLSGRFQQNLKTKVVDLLLPELSLNMQDIYLFKKKNQPARNPLQKLKIRYTLNGTNKITNRIPTVVNGQTRDSVYVFNFENFGNFFENGRKGIKHTIPVSTSMNLFKFFTLTPSFNYNESWYFEKFNYHYDENGKIAKDTLHGFYRVYEYSTAASLSTRLYGTLVFKKGAIQAIRHTLIPSISFNYRPDFGKDKFGYWQELQKDPDSNPVYQNHFDGAVYGVPGRGRIGSIGLSLGNNLEMKVLGKNDSIPKPKKITLLNNLQFSSGYNFLAEQYKLSPISFRTNTSLFKGNLSVAINGTIDPYLYKDDGKNGIKVDQYAWNHGKGIGQLQNVGFSLSTRLNPATFKTAEKVKKAKGSEADKEFILNNPDLYVDFDIPWNLRINYNLTRTKIGLADPKIVQTLRFSGDLKVTEKTMITFNSGYDLKQKEFTQTQFSLTRNLHCWEMLFTWIPFGNFESYEFTIRVKSSMLQDLKLNRRRSFFDTR